MMTGLEDLLARAAERRANDAQRYHLMDMDLCQLCYAYGADKRSLYIACFYDMSEIVPEVIDLTDCNEATRQRGYFLRICKYCRGNLFGVLRGWAHAARERRSVQKDHDGCPEEDDLSRNIPVRIDGATVMMNAEEYDEYSDKAK